MKPGQIPTPPEGETFPEGEVPSMPQGGFGGRICVFPQILLGGVAPAALDVAQAPLGRQVAAADQVAELLHRADEAVRLNIIRGAVAVFAGDDRLVGVCIAQVEMDQARIIEKCAEHYGVYVVRLTESRMSSLDYAKYTCDGKLHPNAEGMAVWAELIEDSMKKCYIK